MGNKGKVMAWHSQLALHCKNIEKDHRKAGGHYCSNSKNTHSRKYCVYYDCPRLDELVTCLVCSEFAGGSIIKIEPARHRPEVERCDGHFVCYDCQKGDAVKTGVVSLGAKPLY